MVWIDQTSHNIPLSRSIIQSKALTLFNSVKAERDEDKCEEKCEANRAWFVRFKERSSLRNISIGRTDVEAETSILWPPDKKS